MSQQLTCGNEDLHTGVPTVAKLSYPDGRYLPTTACASCMQWAIRNARNDVAPITIEPLPKRRRAGA